MIKNELLYNDYWLLTHRPFSDFILLSKFRQYKWNTGFKNLKKYAHGIR